MTFSPAHRFGELAFYGTLMRGLGAQERLGIEGVLRYRGPCRIPGVLWDLGPYPGLVEGEAETAGELYSALDEAVLGILDAFEGPEYERRAIRLVEPRIDAWVYLFVGDLTGRRRVPSGCWKAHALKTGGSRSD